MEPTHLMCWLTQFTSSFFPSLRQLYWKKYAKFQSRKANWFRFFYWKGKQDLTKDWQRINTTLNKVAYHIFSCITPWNIIHTCFWKAEGRESSGRESGQGEGQAAWELSGLTSSPWPLSFASCLFSPSSMVPVPPFTFTPYLLPFCLFPLWSLHPPCTLPYLVLTPLVPAPSPHTAPYPQLWLQFWFWLGLHSGPGQGAGATMCSMCWTRAVISGGWGGERGRQCRTDTMQGRGSGGSSYGCSCCCSCSSSSDWIWAWFGTSAGAATYPLPCTPSKMRGFFRSGTWVQFIILVTSILHLYDFRYTGV